jgi:hypothetical protein
LLGIVRVGIDAFFVFSFLHRAHRDELVKRVSELCKDERHRLERQAREEAAEEEAAVPSFVSRTSMDREDDSGRRHVPTGPKASVERDGLCVVCQENDAQVSGSFCFSLPFFFIRMWEMVVD